IVVFFSASWCLPSCQIARTLQIVKKFPNVLFLEVDVHKLRTVYKEWNIKAMPTFVFLRDDEEIYMVVGPTKDDELHNTIAKHS
ncbi:hypothetical protein MKW92_022821, partial [Papaver armeniacum]